MTSESRFEFVPPRPWRRLAVRRLGRKVVVALMVQPLHLMVGVEVCGPVVGVSVGPLLLAVGIIRPVLSEGAP